MRLRIAEIDQDAVAHVPRDKAAEALDHLGDGAVIGAEDLAQILWIQPRRQLRRADQIAEHHRQLSPLGFRLGPAHRRRDRRAPRCRAQRWRRAIAGDARPNRRRVLSDPRPSGSVIPPRRSRSHGTPARIVRARASVANLRHPSPTRINDNGDAVSYAFAGIATGVRCRRIIAQFMVHIGQAERAGHRPTR